MATVYLATTGSDAYTYSQAQNSATPWLTFAKFLSGSSSGDTCSIAAGTYTWATTTITNRTVIGTDFGGGFPTVIFDAAGASIHWTLAGTTSISNVMLQNGVNTDLNTGTFTTNDAAFTTPFSFTKCVFRNITLTNAANYVIWRDINVTVTTGTLTFTNCLFYNITWNTTATAGRLFFETSPAYFTNCVFYMNVSGHTFAFHAGTAANTINKNSIYQVAAGTATLFATSNTYSDFYGGGLTLPAGAGNKNVDPLFVDAANGNFNLRPTSPCIDTGSL